MQNFIIDLDIIDSGKVIAISRKKYDQYHNVGWDNCQADWSCFKIK